MSEQLNLAHIELLARVDLFAQLDRVALARLAAYVEPLAIADGAAVCRQGDPADGLYIIARGIFGVFTASSEGDSETRVATYQPGDFFGEMALLTAEPRTATVRAEGAGEVLRLESAHFLHLCRQDTAIALTVAATLSERLRVSTRVYLERDHLIDARLTDSLAAYPTDDLERLCRASVLEAASPEALTALFATDAEAVAAQLTVLGRRSGLAEPQILAALRRHCERAHGAAHTLALTREAATHLADAGCWDAALDLLAQHGPRPQFVAALARALRATPPLSPEAARPWLDRLTDDEVATDAALAADRAARLVARGAPLAAHAILQRALSQALVAGDSAGARRLAAELSQAAFPEVTGTAAPAAIRWTRWRVGLGVLLPVAAALALAGAAALVSQPQLIFVLLLAAAIALWAGRTLPDFAVGFGLIAAWILYGLAPPAQAASGFASIDWLFALAVFGLAAAIARSGLLFRVGLLFVRRLPQRLVWQAAALFVTGIILMPFLPSNSGRLAMTMPLALAVAEASRLRDRSPAAAALGLAAWLGSTPLMFVCLNASSLCLLAWGLLPEASRRRFDWFTWLGAAAPLGLLVSLGALAALFLTLRPADQAHPERARVEVQLAVLGPPSRREVAMIGVVALTALGWFGGPAIGLNAGVVAVIGLLLATITGNLDSRALRDLDWDYLSFYGVALSIARLGVALGVDRSAADLIGGPLTSLGLRPFTFLLLIALLSLVVRLVLPQNLGVLLLGLAFIPVAPVIGVDPWIVIIALLATSAMWFLPAQTPYYLFALSTSENRLFSHPQARRVAFSYAAVTLLALALTFPYWHLLGLV